MDKLIHSMGRAGTWLSALLALLLAAGCATSPTPTANEPDSPLLRLAPASLGRTLALQQQLTVAARGQTHRLDVILEADADSVRLAMMNLGQTVATDTLLSRGWAETEDADPSYVWVTMRRLRQKIERDPNRPVHLQTVRGVGYRLVGGSPDAS